MDDLNSFYETCISFIFTLHKSWQNKKKQQQAMSFFTRIMIPKSYNLTTFLKLNTLVDFREVLKFSEVQNRINENHVICIL